MTNPFSNRSLSLSGPTTDIVPVTPDDAANLPDVAVALYVETGGDLVIETVRGGTRTVEMADFTFHLLDRSHRLPAGPLQRSS